jgi:hypothetical protein
MTKYTVKRRLRHDGKLYEPGDTVELDGVKVVPPLLAAKAIEEIKPEPKADQAPAGDAGQPQGEQPQGNGEKGKK